MKLLVIGVNSVRRMLRDRSNIFFVFIFPIAIVLLIGVSFGGSFTPKIGVVDGDGGQLALDLVTALDDDPQLDLVSYRDEGVMLRAVERGEAEAAVVIPAGYDSDLRTGEAVEIGFLARPSGLGPQLQAAVEAVVGRQGQTLAAAQFAAEWTGVAFDQAVDLAENIAPSISGITVETSTVGKATFPETLGRFDLGASSQLVLFVFLTTLAGSASLIESRRLGVSRRMLSTPTSMTSVVGGEALGRFSVALFQGLYIVLATVLIFGVKWGNPVGAAAVLTLFSLVGAGAGLLMGATFRNEQQAGGIGVVAGLVLAALGGCMLPLEFFSPTLLQVAHFTPHAWANDAFADLVRRGAGLGEILPELGVLAGFAVVLLGLAGWRLRTVLTRV